MSHGKLSDSLARALRMRSQHLDGPLPDAASLVRAVAAVQAQESGAAALSIRVRTTGVDLAAVERALVEERSIVRIWAMRGTLHLVASEDAAWLNDLFAPASLRRSHRRLDQLGVPEAHRPRALATIRAALAEQGPLTRAELMEHVARAGVTTAGQAAAHLTAVAALEGHVCFGPSRAGKPTFALRDEWLGGEPPRLPRQRALGELARRYVRAYGPATAHDLAAWAGLPLRDARAGWARIASELLEVELHGQPAWLPKDRAAWLRDPPPDPPLLRLLPAFDTYLLGYRARDLAVAPEHARRVLPGGGILRPTVVANGRALGTWGQRRRADDVAIAVEPFPGQEVDSGALAAEVEDVGRFLGLKATVASA